MKNWGTIITIVITLLLFLSLFLFIYFVITGNPIKKSEAKQEVMEYLIQKENYSKDDILQIKGHYEMLVNSSNNTCHYGAEVIFQNDPNITHYYVACPSNKVIYQGQKNQLE
jgi:hypothetical protein